MKSRDKTVIGVLVLLVIAIGGYFVIVKPKHHQANQLQSQITSEQSQLTQAEAEVRSALSAEAEYKTYVTQLKAIKAAVPSDDQIPELINELQAASTRNRVGFEAVSTSTGSSSAPVSTASTAFPSEGFSLSFTGNFFSVAHLLGTLASFVHADDSHFEASGRLLSISSLSLAPGGSTTSTTGTGSGAVTAQVTASDYDVPTSLLPASSTPASAAPATSTASPAAYITH